MYSCRFRRTQMATGPFPARKSWTRVVRLIAPSCNCNCNCNFAAVQHISWEDIRFGERCLVDSRRPVSTETRYGDGGPIFALEAFLMRCTWWLTSFYDYADAVRADKVCVVGPWAWRRQVANSDTLGALDIPSFLRRCDGWLGRMERSREPSATLFQVSPIPFFVSLPSLTLLSKHRHPSFDCCKRPDAGDIVRQQSPRLEHDLSDETTMW